MTMPKIGATVKCMPQTFMQMDAEGKLFKKALRLVTGKLTYIHPENRFCVVEFDTGKNVIRESFKLSELIV